MKSVLLALTICLGLATASCVEAAYTPLPPPGVYETGVVTFCDDFGCREVDAPYYYDEDGAVVYWDAHFGYWIGPSGYLVGGVWHHGWWPGYHTWYHAGLYHIGRSGFSEHHGFSHGHEIHNGYHGGHRR